MAIDIKKYEKQVNDFNKKYGIKFGLDDYNSKYFSYGLINVPGTETTLYKITMSDLISQVANKRANNINAKPLDMKIFDDFIDMMRGYFADCKAEGRKMPKKISADDRLEIMKTAVNKAKTSQVDLTAQTYKEGGLRIRDMVAKANDLKSGAIGGQAIIEVMTYAQSLKQVVKERSFLSVLGNLSRAIAEWRESRRINNIVKDVLGKDETKVNALIEYINRPNAIVASDLNRITKEFEEKKNPVQNEKKPIEKRDLLKIGYIPNVKNIDQELKMAKELKDAMANDQSMFKGDPMQVFFAEKVLAENHCRALTIEKMVKTMGEDKAKEMLDKLIFTYENNDKDLKKLSPQYEAPEIIEKEPVVGLVDAVNNEPSIKVEPINPQEVISKNPPSSNL